MTQIMKKKRLTGRSKTKKQKNLSLWKLRFFMVLMLLSVFTLLHYDQGSANSKSSLMQTSSGMQAQNRLMLTIVVDTSQQKLYLNQFDKEIKSYPISSSKYGIGSAAGSNKTPLGHHRIVQKIGDGAPEGIVFKGRINTGAFAEINGKNVGDLVTSRILWLEGLEEGKNKGPGIDSYSRYIYIHGTAEENLIGQPASHGCIRMKNRDVIDLFDRVSEGTLVDIR